METRAALAISFEFVLWYPFVENNFFEAVRMRLRVSSLLFCCGVRIFPIIINVSNSFRVLLPQLIKSVHKKHELKFIFFLDNMN